ncbi:MAG TPA: dihydrodipicolinate synthase family protein [Terriglobia bacterium]|nr:dihydrodipicolinate synthase family protein [Terriglobia bacterium]
MNRNQIIAQLKGIFAPVVTPFNRRGDIDAGAFQHNLRRYAGIGLGGIVVAGSTGEAPYLAERERLRLVELARQVVRPPELLMVGTGLESTRETLRLSQEAIARGADALLVVTPNYYKSRMDSTALTAHYRRVADGVRRPVLIYSIPQFTGVHIDAAAIGSLSRHPNILGLKESSGDLAFVKQVLGKVSRRFHVLIGAVQIIFDALCAGAAGGVLGQSDYAPELCVGLYEAFVQGRPETARQLQQRLMPLALKINAPYGVAGVKAACDLAGYAGGPCRGPLITLGAKGRKAVAAALKESRQGLAF